MNRTIAAQEHRLVEELCLSANLGSWTLDAKSDEIVLSESFCRLLKLDSVELRLLHKEFIQRFVHSDDVWFVREYQREHAAQKYSFRVICLDRQVRWLEAFPTVIQHADSSTISGVVQDITDRLESEDGIRNASKMESVRSIAGGIAHEFNNILYSMSGYIGLLKEIAGDFKDTDTAEMAEFLHEIEYGNKRAVRLIKKIQTFSHSGKQGVIPVSLYDAVNKAIFGVPFPEHIHSRIRLEADGAVYVYANFNMLIESLVNIFVNGVDAMNKIGGELAIAIEKVFVEETRLVNCGKLNTGYYGRVEVKDNGSGMDKNTISRIFEPFFTTKQAGRGTGLGLAIVFGMVNAAGGAVEVESELGSGSQFRLYLPACSHTPKE